MIYEFIFKLIIDYTFTFLICIFCIFFICNSNSMFFVIKYDLFIKNKIYCYKVTWRLLLSIFLNNFIYFVSSIYSQTSVQRYFWCKVKNCVVSISMLYRGFAYIIPLSMKEHMVGIKITL